MKDLWEKWRSMDCRQMLKVVKQTFYGGLGLLLAAWIILQCSQDTAPVFAIFLCVLGVIGVFGGILLAYRRLRCPHCGASLMLGGRIPSQLPNFCPECGKPL